MKSIFKKVLMSSAFFFGLMHCFGQMNYTNLEWVDRTPSVGSSIYHTSSIVVSGKLYVTSNIMNGSGNTDIMTIKYDSNGDTLWMSTYAGSAGGDDYGVEIKYLSGNIWVVGAAKNTSTGYDFCVLKYNSTTGGQTYVNNFNGAGNGDDIPTSLLVESSAVYVCGGSEASNGFSDYAVNKLNFGPGSGWTVYYDYNNLHDGANAIVSTGTSVRVTGGSAASVGDWDLATLTIHKLTGTVTSTRTNITGATMVDAKAMSSDALNNIYITGYAVVSGEKNIQTVKLDSNLALVWIKEYTSGTYDDVANDVGVDNAGNVYVSGYNEIQSGRTNFITIKYNSAGTEQWVRQLGNAGEEELAGSEKMCVTTDGEIYLTGTSVIDNRSKMMFVKYDTDGEIKLVRNYESDDVDLEAYDINVYADEVYITGLEKTIDSIRLTVLKYGISERINTPVLDSNNVEMYVNDEVIFCFNPDSIKVDIINKRDITFGTLEDFVQPGVINLMAGKYPGIDWGKVETYKIFKGLTTSDSTSITRLGFEIPVPEFWATLLLVIPDKNERAIRDTFALGAQPVIQHSELNYIFSLCTADPHYASDQYSLYPSINYPDGDINMSQAWLSDVGNTNIKVGIYDTGLRHSHEDLEGYAGGWDYAIGGPLADSPNNGDVNGHGTKVAGIIGATRENGTGVAGVAGGNWPYLPAEEVLQEEIQPGEMRGVKLYGFKTVGAGLSATELYDAILEGALSTTNGYGYGVHLMNCSWRRNIEYTDELDSVQTIWGNVHREVFQNHTTIVASRGNDIGTQKFFPAHAVKEFWVVSVGAADSTGNLYPSSGYGDKLDLIAPGDSMMIYTTSAFGDNVYGRLGQTSAAAAHTSGVAALMYSHINDQLSTVNNLAPEDIEFLLQRYAVDKSNVGYDDTTGWGFLNAGEVMHYIDKSYFVVKHVFAEEVFMLDNSNPDIAVNTTSTFYSTNFKYDDGIHGYGNYTGTQYDVSVKGYHSLNTGDSIHNSWTLNSYTNLYKDEFGSTCLACISFENHIEMMPWTVNNSSAWVSGNVIHFTAAPDGTPIDLWYPAAPGGTLKIGYTLHIETDFASIDEIDTESTFQFSCYPNPASGNLTLSFLLNENALISAEILDFNGRVVQNTESSTLLSGQQFVNFNVNNLANGIYIVRLRVNNEYYYEKFIKE